MISVTKINRSEPGPDQLHTPYKGSDREFTGEVTLK